MKKIHFLFGVHNHQPVGNFEWVLESACEKAYLPFLKALQKHPGVRISLHVSGNLLEWLADKKPEYVEILGKLIENGQVEPMTGGFYEPILPAISDQDKIGQIEKLTKLIEKLFGVTPKGMWLAERVWEPSLAKPIGKAGVEYTLVDDYHFLSTGIAEGELHGYFVTEEDGETLNVFPISKRLRYMIPFHEPEETVRYLSEWKEKIPGEAVIVADDGEKFGVWPGTYELVYEQGWLEKFFSLVESNSEWLLSVPFGEYAAREKPLGRIYLPTASYPEMMEWALPPAAQLACSSFVDRLKKDGHYEQCGGFVHGAFWRNFLVRYPESNRLHKRVLFARERLEELKNHKKVSKDTYESALDWIWRAQVNCPYWHGVFGGLYLPHLRGSAYSNLIAAEGLVAREALDSGLDVSTHVLDINKDGFEEILVETRELSMLIEPEKGGGVFELGWRKHDFNFANCLARRFEAYHERLRAGTGDEEADTGEVRTIHDEIKSKEKGLEKKLFYDWYERGCFLDHFLGKEVALEDFSAARYHEAGDFVNSSYSFSVRGTRDSSLATLTRTGSVETGGEKRRLEVMKRIFVDASHPFVRAEYELLNRSQEALNLRFGIEFNFTFPEDSAGKRIIKISGDRETTFDLQTSGVSAIANGFVIQPSSGHPALELALEIPAGLWRFPVETVSLSESGLERVFQCSSVMPLWEIAIPPGEIWQTELTLRFRNR
ncbi:MAG: DUF1926 domain-containing protein [Candidatus Eisenbacteria bacterium]|nr:DUF1926 domain-containing protein [Candidatus Eisenbacteria bacterium]